MSEQITVRLPDGSTRALATGTTAAGLAEDIGSRLAKAAVIAVVNGEERDLATELARRRRGRHRHGRQRPRAVHDPPLHGPRARPGGARPVPGRHVRHRPAGRGRLLLRLRAARRRPLRGGRPRAGRRADARDHRGGAALRARRAARRQGPRGVRRPPLQARDHRRRQHRPDVGDVGVGVGPHLREPADGSRRRRRRSTATRASSTCAAARTSRPPATTSGTSS